MFSVTVAFGPVTWLLMYRESEKAESAVSLLTTPSSFAAQKVADDFGQTVHWSAPPTAVMLEDMEQSKLMHIEAHIHRVVIQQEVQKRAETDSRLRMARGPGPLIHSPFPVGNNGRPPGAF